MYYPILRGKLNELLALRELANLAIDKKFCPVIEPVRGTLAPLFRTIKELNDKEIEPLVFLNPTVGDLQNQAEYILEQLNNEGGLKYLPIFAVKDNFDSISSVIEKVENYALFLIDGLSNEIIEKSAEAKLTFISSTTAPNLIKRMSNVVLYDDFFKKQKRNADYPNESPFSSLHTYYNEIIGGERVVGFGDYTIISEEYSESGGPAFVVTIHITYINSEKFNEAFIRHYSSNVEEDTPANPGKKFIEALSKFIDDKNSGLINFADTFGVREFQKIYDARHFPGLGQVKKISIVHHVETINDYLIGK
ncbi:sce7725 family protein [Acinetobacter pittii]|uniref:sce7725 family protein n=1 Tax=Acinetobacter pittii TaxID=48296 RepID=UPI001980FC5A|nr:sce7725 family protein [Acinetobacter pittii]MBN6527857.1 sce7725 family protein [Acinetobacter pittii]